MCLYIYNNKYILLYNKFGFMEKPRILINQTYLIGNRLGKGTFGVVYSGKHKWHDKKVAIKLEPLDANTQILKREYKVYKDIYKPNNGICQCHHFGEEGEFTVLVMDLLGDSLGSLLIKNGGQFSLKTVCMIGLQVISRLEYLHEQNYIHRDLKPDNLLIDYNNNTNTNQIFLIDYGLAKKYRINGKHVEQNTGGKLVGTARYASVNSHEGKELSRRDDLISLAYILIYFLKGKLPWQKVKGNTKEDKYNYIYKLKKNLNSSTICENLPKEFMVFLDYCINLSFDEQPNYVYIKNLFRDLINKNGLVYDLIFDWNKLKLS